MAENLAVPNDGQPPEQPNRPLPPWLVKLLASVKEIHTSIKPHLNPKAMAGNLKRGAIASRSRVLDFFRKKESFWAELPDIFSHLTSQDALTRRVTFLFLVSLLGIGVTTSILLGRYWDSKKAMVLAEARRQARKIQELLKEEADKAKRIGNVADIGYYTVEMKDIDLSTAAKNTQNVGEVEVSVLCDSAETRQFIERNLVRVENEITNVLTPVDREEFLSREGKKKLKQNITRKLNDWLPKGKVEDVYFSRMIVN